MTRIQIPQPAARPGKLVSVLNYRRRPAVWETGEVSSAEYRLSKSGGGWWAYTVWISRTETVDKWGRRRGGNYTVYVGDERLRPLGAS